MSERPLPEILSDLLQAAIDGQWSGETNMACHCHPEYARSCPDCKALENRRSNYTGRAEEHEPDCPRLALITEARLYLETQNTLAEERGEDGVYVP
jgi:hypothetical protein